MSSDYERAQKTCDDLSNAKNNAEAGYMNRDAEVTRMKYTIQKLEQDVENRTEVSYSCIYDCMCVYMYV